jgi:Holliday junction resolvasome RuvABC endonuclease subunit
MKKYYNFKTICHHVSEILKKHNPDFVTMEGISYGSVGSAALVDLSGLNFMLRNTISNSCNAEITIVSPTENKRFAVGCGSINKIAIVDTWSRCENFTVNKSAKVDDIADAFFMALYRAVDDESFNDKFVLPTIEITEEHKVKRKKKELDPDVSEAFYNI